ncbi:hypothetical protein FB451DRAFT_1180811 [Mycena latifolia]|nr:hypothetical protein FB451DRAFT_1180811 [Mycena latifolia]
MSSFTFSNNLVEVSALTALLGSGLAESLILGNRGAAGVVWAATSSFGTISVVKACLSGACSGWLRESLGLRTRVSDEAVGLELLQDSYRDGKLRRNLGEPSAIVCHTTQGTCADAYAIDYHNSLMLRRIPETAVGDPIQVFVYANNKFYRPRYAPFQVPAVFFSTVKMVEAYVLWTSGARTLGIVSAVPWLYFFTGAILIQIRELLLSRRREPEFRDLDIITGQLPTVNRRGGRRKIVLGAAEDPRISILWRIFWAVGAVVTTTSIICAYIIMTAVSRNTVLIWAGFQLLWLGARILVYHLAEPATPMLQRLCSVRPYETLSVDLRRRVVNLAFALGRSQTAFHPREQAQYAGDSFSLDALYLVQKTLAPDDGFPLQLPAPRPTSILVDIIAVLGVDSVPVSVLSNTMYELVGVDCNLFEVNPKRIEEEKKVAAGLLEHRDWENLLWNGVWMPPLVFESQ